MDEKSARRLRVPHEDEQWATEIPLPEEDTISAIDAGASSTRSRFWKIGRGALFTMVFLAPLLFLPFTQFPVEASKIVVMAVLAAVALVSCIVCVVERRAFTYPRSLLALAVGAFGVVAGLSAAFSTSPDLSWYGKLVQPDSFLAIALYVLAFFLSFYFFNAEDTRRLGRTFLISMSLATALGIFQMYGLSVWPWSFARATAFSTFGTTFGWGVLMAAVILVWAIKEGEEEKNNGLRAAALLMAIGLLVINFQFLWIALAVALFAIAAMRFMTRVHFRLPLILVVVALFFAVVGSHLPTGAAHITEVRPNFQSTASVATQAIHGWRLLLGSGPSTFSEQFARFRGQGLNATTFWSAPFSQGYDFLLTLFMTGGVLGLLAFFFILFAFGRLALRRRHAEAGPLPSFFFLPLLFLLAILFFYPGFFALMLFIFIGLSMTLIVSDGVVDEGAGFRREVSFENIKRPALMAVFAVGVVASVAALAAAYRVVEKYAAMAQYADAATALSAGNIPLAGQKIQSSIELDDTSDDAWRTGSQIAFAQAQQAFQQASGTLSAAAQQAIKTALTAAQNAVKLDQDNVYNWQALGSIYEGLIPISDGADTLAISAYQNGEKIDPWNPDLPVAIARVYAASSVKLAQSGQQSAAQTALDNAEVQLTQSIALKPDYATPRFMLAQLYIQEGNVAKAIQRVQEIEQTDPSDAGLAFQLGLLYYQNNQITPAQQQFQRAVALDTDYSNARYFLGLIDGQQGNTTDAVAQFTAIQKLNPGNAEVAEILDNLNSGKTALAGISPPAPAPTKRSDVPIK